VFRGLVAAVRDYNEARLVPVDGILGFGLFAECLLTLDYPGNVLRIERGELPAAGSIPFRDERGIPQVDLDVAGRTVPADVDAGAMGGFSLPDTLMAELTLASAPRVVGKARTVSNTFEIRGATLRGTITLGGLRFVDPEVVFQPLFPMANVGTRVLQRYRVTFDQKNRRMKLEQPA
jgi:hypothetical protein